MLHDVFTAEKNGGCGEENPAQEVSICRASSGGCWGGGGGADHLRGRPEGEGLGLVRGLICHLVFGAGDQTYTLQMNYTLALFGVWRGSTFHLR